MAHLMTARSPEMDPDTPRLYAEGGVPLPGKKHGARDECGDF